MSRMIATYYGKQTSLSKLREMCYIDRDGVSLKGISEAAEELGFNTLALKKSYDSKHEKACLLHTPLPVIVHWDQSHFIVVYKNY